MADFDPNKYPGYSKSTAKSGFDPSKYPGYSKDSGADARQRLTHGMQQRMLSSEDFGRGARAGLQNLGAYATHALPQSMQIPRYDPQPTSEYGRGPIEAGKIVSSFAPGLGAEKLVTAGLGAIKQIPAFISRVAGSSAGAAAAAPSIDANPLTAAAIGAGGAAIPEAAMGLMGKYLGKNVTPEEFHQARQSIPSGIKAPIGELADSPNAQRDFAATQSIAFSRADKPYRQLYNHLKKGVKSLTEGSPTTDNANQYIYDDLSKKYSKLRKNTKDSYNEFTRHADESKLEFKRGAYDNYLDEHIAKYKKEFAESPTSEGLDSVTLSTLENFKKDKIDNFSQANRQRKNIRKKIKENLSEDKKFDKSIILGARDALDKSMENSSLKDRTVLEKYLASKKARIEQGEMESLNYKDDTPFYKIHSKNGTPDTLISSYLKTGKDKDYSGLLSNLTDHLSEDGRKALAHAYLNPKEKTSLAEATTRLSKLSPTQRELIFAKKAETAHDISSLANLYGEAKVAKFTPKTGFQGGKAAQQALEFAGGMGLAHYVGIPHAAAAVATLPAAAYGVQRLLRSEPLKDAYMKYLQRSGKGALTKASPTGRAARTAATYATRGDQNGS